MEESMNHPVTPTALAAMVIGRWNRLLTFTESISDEQFFAPLAEVHWSPAENLEHLRLSARPVARLLAGPREVLRQFGKPAGPSRSFDELVVAYKRVLREGDAKAPANFTPRQEAMQDRSLLINQFTSVYQDLATELAGWTPDELEAFGIPHPVLGLLTVREMIYFAVLHSDHHLDLMRQRWQPLR